MSYRRTTEGELLAKLEIKFAPPVFAFFSHVKDSVGFGNRTADGIAVACWRSHGLEIHGFEIKCARADWLRELKHPEKADPIFIYCDRWWIVVSDPAIIQPGELPVNWGVIRPMGSGLKVYIPAPKLSPEPLDRRFVVELLRRQHKKQTHPPEISEAQRRGYVQGLENAEQRFKHKEEDHAALQRQVDEFEKASGIRLSPWTHGEKIGRAVDAIIHGGAEGYRNQLSFLRDRAAGILKAIDAELAEKPSGE